MKHNIRDYEEANAKVKETYKIAREKQTIEYNKRMVFKNMNRKKHKINIWEVVDELSNFIDNSDPDVNIPNAHHLFQTAEGARNHNQADWFQLVCFLHDMGKIMYKWGSDIEGTTIKNQWGIVGDTFIVGCKIPDTIVYPEFNDTNIHHKDGEYGIYYKGCGLDMCYVSWGHDEFMYRVLQHNKNILPEEAYYIIRYHSLYLWHTHNEYKHLENQKDKRMKKWVRVFNVYDLYTKQNLEVDLNKLKEYYSKLILKYFGTEDLYW